MNLLFLNLYSKKVTRGAESFTHELAKRLSSTHQVNFIKGNSSTIPTDKFSRSLFANPAKRLFLDKPNRQVLLFTLRQIPHILTSNYNIIIPLNGFWQVLLLKLIQPFKGFKIVITGHSGPGWDERWNLYLHPNAFVATTGPTLDWARRTCFWTRSTLIPYGIDPKKFTPQNPLPKLKSNDGKALKPPYILCPAALVPYKRIDLTIRAVAKLKQGSLIILGSGPKRRKLERLCHQLLPNRFLITSVPYSQAPEFFARANVVTLASLPQENSPMVFLESLAAGKLVVTTDTPRAHWALASAGFYIDPTNTDSYTRALRSAIKSKPNTHKPLQKFHWDKITNSYNQLFKQLTNNNKQY